MVKGNEDWHYVWPIIDTDMPKMLLIGDLDHLGFPWKSVVHDDIDASI